MNTKSLLDELLKTGKDIAVKGKSIAEEQLQMPAEGAERDAKIDGIKIGQLKKMPLNNSTEKWQRI